MADNVTLPGTGALISAEEVTTLNGGAVTAQEVQRLIMALRTADSTAIDLPGDAANGVDVDVTRLPALVAGEAHAGEVGSKTIFTTITFSLDTNAYADGDILADTQVLSACLRLNDGTGIIQDAIFNDEDDQGIAFDVIVLNANTSLGTENSAPNISDANARTIQGRFSVGTGDWYDLGGVRIANIKNIGIAVKGASGADDIYLALISRGAGTYSSSGITGIIKILCD
jgi:hypothetical protein